MLHFGTIFTLFAIAMFLVSSALETDASMKRKRLLVVDYTQGFRHTEGIEAGEPVLKEIGEKSGAFSVDYCRTAEDVKEMLTPEYLKKYDGVVFLNTTGDLGIPDFNAFLNWIKEGHAFIGMHSATDTYRDPAHAAYIDMIGGEFRTHHNQCEVLPVHDDPQHPAVKSIPADFKITDEIYLFTKTDRRKLHVLLSLPQCPPDGSVEAGKPGDYLLAWCKMYGKGRVFYTAFGHRKDVWDNEVIQKHMLGGIEWALGQVKGDSAPSSASD